MKTYRYGNDIYKCIERTIFIMEISSRIQKRGLLTACIIVFCVIALSYNYYRDNNKMHSEIILDSDSSVKLSLNRMDLIVDVAGIDQKGKQIVKEVDELGLIALKDNERIMEHIIKSSGDKDNTILLSYITEASSGDQKQLDMMKRSIETVVKRNKINATILTQTVNHSSRNAILMGNYNVSLSKANFMDMISKNNMDIYMENLTGLTIDDMYQMLLEKERLSSVVIETIASSATILIGKDEAYGIALEHAGVDVKDIIRYNIELEEENGRQEYDIDFMTKQRDYEYTIDAVTSRIMKYCVEIKE